VPTLVNSILLRSIYCTGAALSESIFRIFEPNTIIFSTVCSFTLAASLCARVCGATPPRAVTIDVVSNSLLYLMTSDNICMFIFLYVFRHIMATVFIMNARFTDFPSLTNKMGMFINH
jgi:hypothetical protein